MCEGGGYIYINIYKKKRKTGPLRRPQKTPESRSRGPGSPVGKEKKKKRKKNRSDAEKLSGSRWVSFDS